MFEGRLPARWQDQAPRIVETPEGHQVWEFDGNRYTQVGMNAVAGRRPETVAVEPFRFDQMRPGCWDIDARIRDMDINGVWASLNFPSQITGFCGRVFSVAKEPELGVLTTRAWNDWLFEEWYSPYPERIIPLGITFLADPEEGARGDPAQRGPRLHVGGPARAAPSHRFPVALRRVLEADHRGVRRDRDGDQPARRLVGRRRQRARRAVPGARRHAVRSAVIDRVCGMAVVGVGGPLPRI